MAITLDIPYRASIKSARSPQATYAFLSDPKASIGQPFPGLRSLQEIAPGVLAWEFDEVGYQSVKVKIAFQTKMICTPPDRVTLAPGTEPHRLSLAWIVRARDQGATADLDMVFSVEIPVPALMKSLVSGFAKPELTKLLERYAANVEKALAT